MAKKSVPSNSAVAKKIEAIKKAAAKNRAATVSGKADSVKKAAAKKVAPKVDKPTVRKTPSKPVASVKKTAPKKVEPVKVEIDYGSYPKTPIVIAWQEMVQSALDRYEASMPDKPTVDQQKRASTLRDRIRMAPYHLRNTGSIQRYSSRTSFDPLVKNTPTTNKKKSVKKKATRKKK